MVLGAAIVVIKLIALNLNAPGQHRFPRSKRYPVSEWSIIAILFSVLFAIFFAILVNIVDAIVVVAGDVSVIDDVVDALEYDFIKNFPIKVGLRGNVLLCWSDWVRIATLLLLYLMLMWMWKATKKGPFK